MPEALSQSHQQHDSCGESDALCCGAWERPCVQEDHDLGVAVQVGWMVDAGW